MIIHNYIIFKGWCKIAVKVVQSETLSYSVPTGDSGDYLAIGTFAMLLISSGGLMFIIRKKNRVQ